MPQEILIILQTHSKNNAPDALHIERYCGASKIEVSKRCTSSLFNTIEKCKLTYPKLQYRLIVVDDDSDETFVNFLKRKIKNASFSCDLVHTEERGLHPSIMKCYELGKEQGKDLVYFAQDDYLYYETALEEMIDAQDQFKKLTGMKVCIFPYDDPVRYSFLNYMYRVFLGKKRHWRNAYHTASCFMMEHSTIIDNWDLFVAMGEGIRGPECEDRSINRLFLNYKEFPERKLDHLLFTPIPSLALHMGFEAEKDPYIEWEKLWNQFQEFDFVELPKDKKIVLNLGSGKQRITKAIYNEYISDYHEVRIDLDEKANPDILHDIAKLPMIPDDSVDAVYSSHSLEHIGFYDVVDCVQEWYRVLKKGGELRIIVPDIATPAKYIAEGDVFHVMYESEVGPIYALDMFYGHKGLAKTNPYMMHKTGFTVKSAKNLLEFLQYEHIVQSDGYDVIIRVRK
jgi:ubiquinone/menaquinone biosynthesis C-methylase UbiE